MAKSVKRDLYFLGDVHGSWNRVLWDIESAYKNFIDTDIIQVGDFGVGFRDKDTEQELLTALNEMLFTLNSKMYIIRGNHDDPSYFTGECRFNFSNIIFVKDYSILNISGNNILFVGGAVSIDRNYRIRNNMHHFKDEAFVLDLNSIPNSTEKNIDIVVTHTSPNFCYPIGFNNLVYSFAAHDPELLSDLNQERALVTTLFRHLDDLGHKIRAHYYGHFHTSKTELIADTHHTVVGIHEFKDFI